MSEVKPLAFISRFLRPDRRVLVAIVVFVFLGSAFSLAEPWFFKYVIDRYVTKIGDFEKSEFFRSISWLMLAWVAVAFLSRTFRNLQEYLTTVVSDRAGIRIFDHAFSHVLGLSMDYHEEKKSGEVMRKIQKAREDIARFVKIGLDRIAQNFTVFAIVTIIAFVKDWRMGALILINVPIFSAITFSLTRKIKTFQRDINIKTEQLHGTAYQALDHPEVVKAFTTEQHERNLADRDNWQTHAFLKLKTVVWRRLGFIQGTIINLARSLIIWVGALLVFAGDLTVGDIILFTFYAVTIYQPLYELSDLYTTYQEGITSVERLQELLGQNPSVREPDKPFRPKGFIGRVEFENVSFSYKQGRAVIRDISFTLEPGMKLGIVGGSGSGKSTIVKLILRYYDPTAGRILVDGRQVREWDLTELRRRISVVFQDNVLFNDTVAANVRYGSFSASLEEVIEAAKFANAHDFIMKFPKGYETLVGPRGMKLSGGERQRIAIARAVIKKPRIFIFDEATSSLDSRSERLVQQAIDRVSAEASTITIAHRFSTIQNADLILVLNECRIVERGTHEQLVGKEGEYETLWRLQQKPDVVEEASEEPDAIQSSITSQPVRIPESM